MTKIYDSEIKARLKHLSLLPCYLPYVGEHYSTASTKIMIIAESHYLDEAYDNLFSAEDWHKDPLAVYERIDKDIQGWMNTRGVLNYYRSCKKLAKGHLIFHNLESAYLSLNSGRKLFDECVYINYFQRPSEVSGETIKIHPLDSKLALENIIALNDILKPNKIIFVSSKAYDNFIFNVTDEQSVNLPYIGSVPHPSATSWWNRQSKKYGFNDAGEIATGREKFERIIKPKKT